MQTTIETRKRDVHRQLRNDPFILKAFRQRRQLRPVSLAALFAHVLSACASLAAMNFAFVHEGTSIISAVPEMMSLDAWVPVWPFLSATSIAAVGMIVLLRRVVIRNSRAGLLSAQLAMLLAALTTLGYDQLRESGVSWLPSIGGCHCWLTTVAGVLAASLMMLIVMLIAIVGIRVAVALQYSFVRYLKRMKLRATRRFLPRSFCYGEPDWDAVVPARGPPIFVH